MKKKILKILYKTLGVGCILMPFVWTIPLVMDAIIGKGDWDIVFLLALCILVSIQSVQLGELMLIDEWLDD